MIICAAPSAHAMRVSSRLPLGDELLGQRSQTDLTQTAVRQDRRHAAPLLRGPAA